MRKDAVVADADPCHRSGEPLLRQAMRQQPKRKGQGHGQGTLFRLTHLIGITRPSDEASSILRNLFVPSLLATRAKRHEEAPWTGVMQGVVSRDLP